MVLSQPDGSAKMEKDSVHLQSNGVKEKTFVLEREKRDHIWFLRNARAWEGGAAKETKEHARMRRRQRERRRQINRACGEKAVLSAMVFILGFLPSVWLHELFIKAGMCRKYSSTVDEIKLRGWRGYTTGKPQT